jgi:hypothetical protein
LKARRGSGQNIHGRRKARVLIWKRRLVQGDPHTVNTLG